MGNYLGMVGNTVIVVGLLTGAAYKVSTVNYYISGKVTKKTCQGKLTLELEKDGITRILNNVRPEHSDIYSFIIKITNIFE